MGNLTQADKQAWKCCVKGWWVWNYVTKLCALADAPLNYWTDLVEKLSD